MKSYKLKYVTAGRGGPKMYGVLRFKSDDQGWVVEVWVCDIHGRQASDPVEWRDELCWFAARKLFWRYYHRYNKFVNKGRY